MIKQNYLETKEFTVEILYEYYKLNKPFEHGTNDVFEDLINPKDVELLFYFVAIALFQIKRDGLEARVEEQVTYWIYQYKKGVFKNLIENEELLKKDIQKIESMITLRFEDLECYEADK